MQYTLRLFSSVLLFAFLIGCESSVEAPQPTAEDMPEQARTATAFLPANSRMMAMVDLQQMRTHGPAALQEAFAEISDPSMNGSGQLQEFLAESGMDLSKDVERVYLTQAGTEGGRPHMVITGTFNRERIGQALQARTGRDFQTVTLSGVSAFTLQRDDGSDVSLAVVRDDMLLIAPSQHDLNAMLERSAASDGPSSSDGMLIQAASQGQSAWYVLRGLDGAPSSDAPDNMARLGRALQDMAGSFTFTDGGALDGTLVLVPKPSASSADVADVVRGLVAAAKQSSDMNADARQALDRMEVRTTSDGTVSVSAQLPASLVNRLADTDGE